MASTMIVAIWLLTVAPIPKDTLTTAERLHGDWELVKSRGKVPGQKHIATFHKDGTLTLTVGTGDAVHTYKGKFTATDEAIDYELDTGGDAPKKERLKIQSFEKDDLKVTDPDNIEEEFRRVKK
jgi:uncharacterized protein (TIGR03066 family)